MALLFIYFTIAICISFLCSMLEAVLLSTSPSYIESTLQQGKVSGKIFKKLKKDIDKPLSAILTLNTIAHTVGAAGVGAQATKIFGEAYIGITSAILTLLILVLSEIIPKSIGAVYWKSLTGFTAKTLRFLILILYPFVLMALAITKLITRNKKQPMTSREEVAAMASIGREEGIFKEEESRIIKNLIKLKSISVENVMTPRTVMISFSENDTIDHVLKEKEALRFSRIPVYQEEIDNISGYVLKFDILDLKDKPDTKLIKIKRDIMIIYEKKSIAELFEKMLEKKEHITLVLDEYGGVSGIATLEDVLETILGMEIVDEMDTNIDMQQYAREKWKERATNLGLLQAFEQKKEKD